MFSRIEATHFRCLRQVTQGLGSFHVLVGPNASGKTTFLDVVAFVSDLVTHGLDVAVHSRTQNFEDLLWMRTGDGFKLALEAHLPSHVLHDETYYAIRYQISIVRDLTRNELAIFGESVSLLSLDEEMHRPVVTKTANQDVFVPETYDEGPLRPFALGPRRSALGSLPDDENLFPAALWLKGLLSQGVNNVVLDSQAMRRASPPGQGLAFTPDGSNLPWVIGTLQTSDSDRFASWIAHLQAALPDLEGIRVVERADDRHRYLMLRYRGGLEVPSWMTSDGTLRLLALTLLAYMPEREAVYLIEEPENGIHPRAIETMYQSLSNVYGAQVLLATHSPIVLSMVEPKHLLCFSKDAEGATQIVTGDDHPALKEWRHETNLSTLFAAGVLG